MPGAGPGSTMAATTPDPVRGLIATPDGPTNIKLSWVKPANNGGHEITAYRIEISTDMDDNATHVGTWPLAGDVPTLEEDACTPVLPCVRETVGVNSTEYTYKGEQLGCWRSQVVPGDCDKQGQRGPHRTQPHGYE